MIRALVEEVFEQNIERKNTNAAEEISLPPGGNLCAYLHRYDPNTKGLLFSLRKGVEGYISSIELQVEVLRLSRWEFDVRPFYKLRLIDQKETFRVHEVVVGPTPNPQQSKMSVSGFLVRNGFKAPVELSMVPYRNW